MLSGAEEAITEGTADVVVTTRVPPGFLGEPLLDVTFLAVAHPDHELFRLDVPLTTEHLVHHVQVVVRDSGVKHPRDEGWLGADRRCTGQQRRSLALRRFRRGLRTRGCRSICSRSPSSVGR